MDLASLGTIDVWTLMVLMMDGLLVFQASANVAPFACAATLIWIIIRSVEDAIPFGLWDAVPGAERYSNKSEEIGNKRL